MLGADSGDGAAMMDDTTDLHAPLLRAEGYRLLSAAFGYPDVEELACLFDEAETAARSAQQSELASMAGRLLSAVTPDLTGEYNRLFAQAVAVSPYETSYVAADKGVQLGRLAALMEAFGVRSRGDEHESPDHIGSELEFMAFLCLKEASHRTETSDEGHAAYESVRCVQELFLQEHLGVWAEVFADRLKRATRHPFYSLLAELLPAWLQHDLARNGWHCEAIAPRLHLPLLQPDGSLRSTIETGDLDDEALICPMADPAADGGESAPIPIG